MTTGRLIAALLFALPALHATASFADPRETCTRRAPARPAQLAELECWRTPVAYAEARLPIQHRAETRTVSPACLLVVPMAEPGVTASPVNVGEVASPSSIAQASAVVR